MTTASTASHPKAFARWRLITLIAGALTAAGAMYFLMRPGPPAVPTVATDGLDPDVAAAITKSRDAVVADPRSAAAWGEFGTVLFAQRRYDDSVPVLVEAERIDPDNSRWPYLRGLALILERPEEGLQALRQAAALKLSSFSIRLRLAEELLKQDRLDEADAEFARLLDETPENPRVQLGMGLVLSRRERWREAAPLLQSAAEHPTAKRSALVALSAVYARLGDAAAAETASKRAADADADLPWPDPILADVEKRAAGLQARVDRSLRLLREGQAGEAEEILTQLAQSRPESDEAHLALAKVYIRQNRMPDAGRQLQEAIAINSRLIEAHFLLGGVHMVRGEFPAAERCYERAIELRPAYAAAHFALGQCRVKMKKNSLALAAFRDAVRYRPDFVAAQIELADLLLEDGNTDEAIAHLEDALRTDPKSARAQALLDSARSKGRK